MSGRIRAAGIPRGSLVTFSGSPGDYVAAPSRLTKWDSGEVCTHLSHAGR